MIGLRFLFHLSAQPKTDRTSAFMNYLRIITTIWFYLSFTQAYAQKEGNIWHFGHGAALDFNTGTAVISGPSAMSTFEGSASISDANGTLLFYSNGGGRDPLLSGQSSGKIWNRNHQIMYDMGNTEGGGFSSAQSAVIVPKPGASGQYYLFTMEELEFDVGGSVPGQPIGRGLSYFEVDMSLNAGLGGVSSYSGMVYVPSYEGLCAIRHANGSDYWILVHQSSGLGLAVFPLSVSGLGNPAFYAVPTGSSGVIKGSPDGHWVSSLTSNNGQLLFSFDPATGMLGSPLLLNTPARFSEFSPNGKRIFLLGSNNEMDYYDLTAMNINGSKMSLGIVPSPGITNAQMQLAPDGEIYFIQHSFPEQTVFLSSIVCPNANPFFNLRKIAFPYIENNFFLGLPNFDNAIFRQEGDPILPIHLGQDQTLCGQDTILLDAGLSNASYQWSNGVQTQTLAVSTPGIYAVTVSANGCGTGVDSIEIFQVDLLANAGDDLAICNGEGLTLDGMGQGTIQWMPDSLVSDPNIADPEFIGDASASLILTVTQAGCTEQDTIFVTVHDNPVASVVPADTTIVAGESVLLSGAGSGSFAWTPENGLSCVDCPSPLASPEDSTTYVLTVTNAAGCTDTVQVQVRVTPPDCQPEVPNAFTPNGDGANDEFEPIGETIESFVLTVFNRWGQTVFHGNTPWDGRQNGLDAPSDVYVFQLMIRLCDTVIPVTNQVTLLR